MQMDRVAEMELLDFCAKQKARFSVQRWHEFGSVKNSELAAAALFLAGVDWYGHKDDLLDVAEHLHPGYVGKFSQLAKESAMDCSRFSNMLKARLAHNDKSLSRAS
jgi:hypothetical protein